MNNKLNYFLLSINAIKRRRHWFGDQFNFRKLINYLILGVTFVLKKQVVHAWPAALKIDISPICNLHCPTCIHAEPGDNPLLQKQEFKGKYMTIDLYKKIVNEAKGRIPVFSLYYLGDPFMHPDIDEMCRLAKDAGINVHLSTNFSLKFSDERIISIINSGVCHLSVCVDGITQEVYEKTRKGGRIDFVLSNLTRVIEFRNKSGKKYPIVEVQYIKFTHNAYQIPDALALFQKIGVDHIQIVDGHVTNYCDVERKSSDVFQPRPKKTNRGCFWPYFFMVIKYNGDVIPCCAFRLATQYCSDENPRVLGNIYDNDIFSIWNSSVYRQIRYLTINPNGVEYDEKLKNTFCYGCRNLYTLKKL
ncbi:MAG: radical SAM protein [Chlorobiaceae bacterium]|nr:radical SAM protein [Chlorobiaceae bacterium]